VIPSMVAADPAYTATWINQFPEGSLRDEATQTLVNQWSREDPIATADWLNTIPAGKGREDAVASFANSLAPHEPATAWEWAGTLGDAEKQKSALENAGRQWLRVDEASARAAIEQSTLPPDVKDRLLKGGG
ncbi:MAG: hypothetical protein KIT22_17065, partial [Verrucomicrobiae bacterium]|nr:hypothetical protein [Verrucomicrobiae bacterium]